MTKRALISVSDKSNIVEFAKGLEKFGFWNNKYRRYIYTFKK